MPSLVTVLLAVFNGERFLQRALNSLLAQTWQHFEVIVIDDGSTDATPTILADVRDPRVSIHRNPQNIGLTRSLNQGLRLARGEYLARLDADDVAIPTRLATQVAFLDEHREVGLLGTDCDVIDEDDHVIGARIFPKSHTAIRCKHFVENAFCHSSVMLRRSILELHRLSFDEGLRCAQDFDLWTRLLRHTQGRNLATRLVSWRWHPNSVSALYLSEQIAVARGVIVRETSALLGRPVEAALVQEMRGWAHQIPACETDVHWRTALLMTDVFEALSSCSDIDQEELTTIYGDWLFRLSSSIPAVRWPFWIRAALLRRNALPHWPRIAGQVWGRIRSRMRRVGG
jgi:hypothetical protein